MYAMLVLVTELGNVHLPASIWEMEGQYVKAADVTGRNPSRFFFISDRDSGLCFHIDTGAQVSVIPPSAEDRNFPSTLTLQAVSQYCIFLSITIEA